MIYNIHTTDEGFSSAPIDGFTCKYTQFRVVQHTKLTTGYHSFAGSFPRVPE